MTRILVQRGSSGGSSSNPSRSSCIPGSSSARAEPQVATPQVLSAVKDEESGEEVQEQVIVDELLDSCGSSSDSKVVKSDDLSCCSDQEENSSDDTVNNEKVSSEDIVGSGELAKGLSDLRISDRGTVEDEDSGGDASQNNSGSSQPPPPPVPPPKPSASNSNSRRFTSGSSNAMRIGPSRRAVAWPIVSTRTSPTESRPSSPRSHGECEGYNSADEQNPCFVSSYDDIVSFCLLSPSNQVLLVFRRDFLGALIEIDVLGIVTQLLMYIKYFWFVFFSCISEALNSKGAVFQLYLEYL